MSHVAQSAAQIGAGNYHTRVEPSGLATEFDDLTVTINELAERLQHVEDTRRRMLSDLAHEMRTPLATVTATLEAIEDKIWIADTRTLDIIRSATFRLRRLADDIAEVSELTENVPSLHVEVVNSADLVGVAIREARARFAETGIEVTAGPTTQGAVLVDSDRMAQVIHNLLNNAHRHTAPGGRITISSEDLSNSRIAIRVVDTGDGISADHLPHVFDRFYRTDASRSREAGGTGIGLTIARAIVEAHNGLITASSPGLGKGATFSVILPRAD